MPWQIEVIPDESLLFRRVHKNLMVNGQVTIAAFKNVQGGMSVDWNKYSTAEEARQRARSPQDNAVVKLVAGQVRQVLGQTVAHTPTEDNRAHSEVLGEKSVEVRTRLLEICEMVIPLSIR